jgi:peptide/nickel transport system permease protein
MILGETALSFLGLGVQPPMVSWGLMLDKLKEVPTLRYYPWMLIPVVFLVVAVLCFNFVGDALRDVSDPHSK